MAVRKGSKNKNTSKKPGKSSGIIVLFWLAFVIFIFGIYLLNREDISNGIRIIQNVFAGRNDPGGAVQPVDPMPEQPAPIQPPVQAAPQQTETVAQLPHQAVPQSPEPEAESTGRGSRPEVQPEMRDRVLYFTQVDRTGTILRVRVDRRFPASTSPLADVLHALIAGPNEEERQRGLISLIPPGSQLISIRIEGATAFINFNEDFQYNTFGVEGYAAQLREVVFTATEFSNIRDVQILIEGRRIDFLGEGIWIGGPLNREMF